MTYILNGIKENTADLKIELKEMKETIIASTQATNIINSRLVALETRVEECSYCHRKCND